MTSPFAFRWGRVFAQDYAGRGWWILTPDAKGSYSAGSWTAAAPMSKARLYFTSAVLMDGRVLVGGGEYTGVDHATQQTEENSVEIYDPNGNSWSPAPSPPGWAYVGDGPSAVLPDGRLVLGNISDDRTAIFEPKTLSWTDGGHKRTPSAEESWVLQGDGSVLTVDCTGAKAGRGERWVPAPRGGGSWQDAGQPTQPLVQSGLEEIGPGMLLPDLRTLFVGATGHTELYSPPKSAGAAGTWAKGPDLPLDATGRQQVAPAS